MRAELMTGPVRRRQWRKEDKLRILREAFAPGAVVSDVARRHDVVAAEVILPKSAEVKFPRVE